MPVSLDEYGAKSPSVVALGTFDGVHLGHQALLRQARAPAETHGWISLAFVFSHPPGNYLGYAKPLLIPPLLKYRLIEGVVHRVVFAEFPKLAWMQPEQFAQYVLCKRLRAQAVVVGENYCFGKDRAGDVALLKELGQGYGFEVYAVPAVKVAGDVVSSTRIRRVLRAGEVGAAAQLLGRPPLLCGRVIRGEGRGHKLGYPTANLEKTSSYVSPEQGIFAGIACLEQTPYPAAIYIGTKPTFDGEERAVEVHLLEGAPPPLYDATLCVHLIEKIRDDATFAGTEALKVQIQTDITRAHQVLNDVSIDLFCEPAYHDQN